MNSTEFNFQLTKGEVRPQFCKVAAVPNVYGKLSMVTTDGVDVVEIIRSKIAPSIYTYKVIGKDGAVVISGVSQSLALQAMRKAWKDLGATVYGTDSCYSAFLRRK